MRDIVQRVRLPLRPLVLLGLGACQPPIGLQPASGTTVGITSVSGGSSWDGSTSGSSSTGTTTSTSTTTGESGAGEVDDTAVESPPDLGVMPDFGEGAPVGCGGKIDFLFVMSRQSNVQYFQKQLVAAFPNFIDTIESKFADFDYHIMVVDGDPYWGGPVCTEICPNLGCKVGEPCCPWQDDKQNGEPCCTDPESYPCDDLHLVTKCDEMWGAGTVFPAGKFSSDKRCPIDGDLRYLVKGQTNLKSTFECIATIGASGYDMLGQALMAAIKKPINDPGGCNRGFLRGDALLMVTFMYANPDQDSEGTYEEWAQAVIAAKHGDDRAVVMLNIGRTECDGDRICDMVKSFPYHHVYDSEALDYAEGFNKAADLVETACAGFVVPG